MNLSARTDELFLYLGINFSKFFSYFNDRCFLFFQVRLVVLVTASFVPSIANSEVWQLVPELTVEQRYDDNYTLTRSPHDPVFESILRGVLAFNRQAETTEFTGRMHGDFSNQKRSRQYVTFDAKKKSERSFWGLDGSFRTDTTVRNVQIVPADENSNAPIVDNVDESLSEIEVRRNALQLKPYFRHQFTEVLSAGVLYDFQKVIYSNKAEETGVYDYQLQTLAGSFMLRTSERESISTVLAVSQFDSADVNSGTANNGSALFGYKNSISEITDFFIEGGLRFPLGSVAENSDGSGFILRLNIEHKSDLGSILVNLFHGYEPSGVGGLIETNQVRLVLKRSFMERLSGNLLLKATENKPIALSTPRDWYYFEVIPQMSWKITRWWSLGGGYRYRMREQANSMNDVDSNSVFLSLRYSKEIVIE